MTDDQMEAWEKIRSVSDRAKFLLSIGVTAELETDEPNLEFRAYVGDVRLPITGATKLTAIERGTTWLQEKAREAEERKQ
ncbi:hypothetical protein MO867_16895 [Microbulbifer sp. OS29]|uniref:Uncharacterized protein n=1 Tax=Microbulbifer okhotskensis TaxID=2926617 RepID=A0A9X2EQN3_9GAMM|nr:hypothetical protein [Microbulbifer okhotskensis]MCO1336010.1 hypothetical protein [Microbulbifer okhotskensis]